MKQKSMMSRGFFVADQIGKRRRVRSLVEQMALHSPADSSTAREHGVIATPCGGVFAFCGAAGVAFLLMQIGDDAVAGGVSMMNRGAEGPPYAPVPRVLLEHAFGMKLQADDEAMAGIVEGFHQAVFGMRHGLQAAAQAARALMVIAIHEQLAAPIPLLERRAGDDGHRMAVFVIVFVVDMLQLGLLLLLHVAK